MGVKIGKLIYGRHFFGYDPKQTPATTEGGALKINNCTWCDGTGLAGTKKNRSKTKKCKYCKGELA